MGEILHDAMEEVAQYGESNAHADFLAKSVQKFYAKTLGGRSYGVFEAVHLGLGLPLVLSMLPIETLSVWGGRRMKTRKEQEREGEPPVQGQHRS